MPDSLSAQFDDLLLAYADDIAEVLHVVFEKGAGLAQIFPHWHGLGTALGYAEVCLHSFEDLRYRFFS